MYSFGSPTPNRHYSNSITYRYGFNGKEKDNEGLGGGGSTYDYGFRIYNPALGRFLSVDPLSEDYPWYTPYQFAGNKPIEAIDLDGLEEFFIREIEQGNEWILSVRLTRKDKGKNTFQNVSIDGDPVGVIQPITPELKIYTDKVKKYFEDEKKDGAIFSRKTPVINKSDAKDIENKKTRPTAEAKSASKIDNKEVVKDPTPPPAFNNSNAEVFVENSSWKGGYIKGTDFEKLANDIVTYLLENPKADLAIVLGGGNMKNVVLKNWNDPISSVKGSPTYAERAMNEFKTIVREVIKLSKGSLDESRLKYQQGEVFQADVKVEPISNDK